MRRRSAALPAIKTTQLETSSLAEYFFSPYCRQYNYQVGITMEEAVSAAEANRKFSLILRGVREGHSYVVTSHGRPVARIVPANKRESVMSGARAALLARLERQPVVDAGRWARDELYEDER